MHSLCRVRMQFRTVLDVKVVDVEKRRNPSKHYVSPRPEPVLIRLFLYSSPLRMFDVSELTERYLNASLSC